VQYDVLVVGASLGGVAAALRAAEMGAQTCLIDPGDWVGGQFTAQGVCKPDENQYIETVASTRSYRAFKDAARAYYRANAKLSLTGRSQPIFNLGGGYDARQPQFAVEPLRGDAILKQMMQAAPALHWRPNTPVERCELAGDAVGAVLARNADGSETRFAAKYVLDATDLGDMLPLALREGEWVVGAESRHDTGESGAYAPEVAQPAWIQPITYVFALEHRPHGEDHTIPKPPNYERHRAEQKYSVHDGAITSMFGRGMNMFNYRQYLAARNFDDPAYRYDRTTMNTGSNDYGRASIPTGDAARDADIVREAREAALGYLYWIQTECPRQDGSAHTGFPELRPVTEAFGTPDGVAPAAYIRESRRIKALATIVQQDIQKSGNPGPRAKLFDDSCGIGTYAFMDGHALPGQGMGGFWIDVLPAQIRTRALIPRRVTNLLAACKNLGTTHLTSALYRLHPLEWNVGEAAGALAAFCIAKGTTPHDVANDGDRMRAFQRALVAQGVPLFWWTDVKPDDPLWTAVQLAGATLTLTTDGDRNADMRFNPDAAVSDAERTAVGKLIGAQVPADVTSRGHLAQWLLEAGYTEASSDARIV
jgi:hypothetical protein